MTGRPRPAGAVRRGWYVHLDGRWVEVADHPLVTDRVARLFLADGTEHGFAADEPILSCTPEEQTP